MARGVDTRALEEVVTTLIAAEESAGRLAPETGIAVSVVHDGAVAYEGAFGLRDRARRLPVTGKTIFDIGSLTKAFTATALVQAHERKKLDLDTPLAAQGFLDPRRPHSAEVTLADILSHQTGLPAHDCLWYFGGYSTRELGARLARLEPIPNAFRSAFVYNNALYGCTSAIVEDALDRSWQSLVGEEILGPLGMSATTLGPTVTGADEALPYLGRDATARKDASCVAAAGGARSTIEDMTRWIRFQLGRGGSLLSERSMQTMHDEKISAAGMNPLLLSGLEWLGTSGYGYGWFLGNTRGQRAVHHMGFIDGFSSVMTLFPDLALGIVVLANTNLSPFPGLLAEHLFARMAGHEPPSSTSVAAPPAGEQRDARPLLLPPRGTEGAYEDAAYGRIEVEREGDELRLAYRGYVWPLRFRAPAQAELVIHAFGLTIPLSAEVGDDRVVIPLSLDPRVAPQVFAR